jgi:hypothetical protein
VDDQQVVIDDQRHVNRLRLLGGKVWVIHDDLCGGTVVVPTGDPVGEHSLSNWGEAIGWRSPGTIQQLAPLTRLLAGALDAGLQFRVQLHLRSHDGKELDTRHCLSGERVEYL